MGVAKALTNTEKTITALAELGDRRAPLRLVLDTNVVLDLYFFRDPAALPLGETRASGAALFLTSEECLAEFGHVLTRAPFSADPGRARRAGEDYRAQALTMNPSPTPRLPRCRDPDDQKFLELAVAARADLLVTKDKALLKLARVRYGLTGVSILTPARACALLGAGAPATPAP